MASKRWSYEAVTAKAEEKIKSLLASGERPPADISEEVWSKMHRGWAYGVYLGWRVLTSGWQKDGDDARLEAQALGKEDGK